MRTKPVEKLTDIEVATMSIEALSEYSEENGDLILDRRERIFGVKLRDFVERLWEIVNCPYYKDKELARKVINLALSELQEIEDNTEDCIAPDTLALASIRTRKLESLARKCL